MIWPLVDHCLQDYDVETIETCNLGYDALVLMERTIIVVTISGLKCAGTVREAESVQTTV